MFEPETGLNSDGPKPKPQTLKSTIKCILKNEKKGKKYLSRPMVDIKEKEMREGLASKVPRT